jgi:hypothetical protein
MASSVLNYRFPPVLPSSVNIRANSEQWQLGITPTNGVEFRSDQSSSIVFNVQNPNHFIRTVQSFFDGYVIPVDSSGNEVINPGTTSTYQGVSAFIARHEIRMSGQPIENNEFYDVGVNWLYSTMSPGKKKMLKKLEGYSDPNYFASGKKRFVHPLVSALHLTDQAIPLPILAQTGTGYSIELWLKPADQVFTSANVAYYKIAPRFNYLAIVPDVAYTAALINANLANKAIYMHFARPQWFQSNGNGSMQQNIVLGVGQVTSVLSWQMGFYNEADFADRSKDKSKRWHNAYISGYRMIHNGISNPNIGNINFEGGGKDLTLTLINLLSQNGNIYTMGDDLDLPDNYETENFTVGYSFVSQTETAGCGLSTVANPVLTIETKHSQVVPNNCRILTMVIKEAIVQLRGSQVGVAELF